jgi:putative FmdB family regulatory protein
MPIYTYLCPKCGELCEAMHTVEERKLEKCKKCGVQLDIVIMLSPNHPKEMLRYFDKGLGCYVESRDHRKRIMEERGLREAGDSGDDLAKLAQETREFDLDTNHSRR